MKKILVLLLALAMVLSVSLTALADPTMKNGELPDVIEPNGGPYIIVTAMTEDSVTFKYGWSNVNFFGELRPVQVWIGLYNETDSHYAYVEEEIDIAPNQPNHKGAFTLALEPGDQYKINFFIRWQIDPTENVWWHELFIN